MAKESQEAKFDRLRARHLEKQKALYSFQSKLQQRLGPGWNSSWLKASDEDKLHRLREAADKTGRTFFDYLQSISPRDWSYGVPAYWVHETLTFADAMRPTNEPLSVVPPMAYGATEPRT